MFYYHSAQVLMRMEQKTYTIRVSRPTGTVLIFKQSIGTPVRVNKPSFVPRSRLFPVRAKGQGTFWLSDGSAYYIQTMILRVTSKKITVVNC